MRVVDQTGEELEDTRPAREPANRAAIVVPEAIVAVTATADGADAIVVRVVTAATAARAANAAKVPKIRAMCPT
jgi:hypothetical protein